MRRFPLKAFACVLAFLAMHPRGWPATNRWPLLSYDSTWRYDESGKIPDEGWMMPEFDDRQWDAGKGAFLAPANKSLGGHATPGTALHGGNRLPGGQVIHLFRTRFFLEVPPAHVDLIASNLLNNGAIIYLNGHEAGRDGVPSGSGPSVYAETSDEESQRGARMLRLPVEFARSGTNVIAVELHQDSRSSSDAVFAMSLWAEKMTEGGLVWVVQPKDATLFPGDRFELQTAVRGTLPISLQWFKNGEPLPGAAASTLRKERVDVADAGIYMLTASNALGVVASTNATLAVQGPGLVPFHGSWKYQLIDNRLPESPLATNWHEPGFNDAGWRTGEAPIGASFRPGYDPPAKPYRTKLAESFNPVGLDPDNAGTSLPIVSLYRAWFTWPHSNAVADLKLTTMFDDGGIVYLNGKSILQVGMVPGPIDFMSQANRRVANPALEIFSLSGIPLTHGSNLVAVSLHQNSWGSGDMAFALQLEVPHFKHAPPARQTEATPERLRPTVPRVKLVSVGHLWQFHPADPRWTTNWMQPGPAGIPWPEGHGVLVGGFVDLKSLREPKGGDLPLESDPLWLRASFLMPEEAAGGTLFLRHLVDDGARFFLNGVEVHRFNIPHGQPDQSRRARSRIRTKAWSDFEVIPNQSLQTRTNWLAVELRRGPGVDQDLVFACELVVEAGSSP